MNLQLYAPVKNLEETVAFYRSLDYQLLELTQDAAFITDGMLILHLDAKSRYSRGLNFYVPSLQDQLASLKETDLSIRVNTDEEAQLKELIIEDPNGVGIRFFEAANELQLKEDMIPCTLCGTHYGLGIMAIDFVQTIDFWEALGYKLTSGDRESKSYVEMSNGTVPIGIYREGSCPHLFVTPSLTYFEADMADRIAAAKKRGIKFVEEITQFNDEGIVDHAIWGAPDGWHAFMFKG